MAHRLTTCTFCGVGCGLYVETAGNHILGVYPSVSHPTNQGKICVRGWHVHEVASSPDRITRPLVRTGRSFQEVSWEAAFGYIADRLREIRDRHGANSLAFLNSPRCSNEEAYLLQKLARCVIGTNNVHHGTGVYCNNSINALIEMLGVPASTNSLQELADSEVIIVDGVDLGRRMPTLAGVVLRAKLKGARLIVLGTRRHRLAESADLFLQMKPGTEALVYGAMQKVIVDRGLADLHFIKARCSNYDAFLSEISHYDLLQAAEGSGVAPELIESAAILFAKAARAAVLYSTSMEDRSREAVQAAVNLVLLSGQLGKTGSGLFPLCEQNNLQGVCDMGMLPDRLPGYVPVADAARRSTFEEIWRTKLPEDPGHGARSILWQRGNGVLKALWLGRYDPVQTAFLPEITDYLRQFELLVVQHVFMTATAELAHVVLPTTAFGEEQVSFTSTDRRIQLAEQVVEPPGGLLPAWAQIMRVAQLMGADWNYANAAAVMDEIGTVVPLYSGASYENLGRDYGRQWPCTSDRPLGTQFLFAENGTSRKFHFAAAPKPALADNTSKEFPFMLVFGSSLYYWSQNVLVRHSETLKREYRWLFLDYPGGFVELNSADAAAIGVRDGQQIRLMTERNSATCAARVTDEVMKGAIFVPYFMSDVERQMLGGTGNGACLLPVRIEKEAA